MFNTPQTPLRTGTSSRTLSTRGVREEERERSLFERIFAPFEAPQQFLYSLTRESARDGFQWGDLLTASSHAGRYFNPFSNQQRIDENEIRQILFGDDPEDMESLGFGRSALNLGLAIFFDPLWLLGPARAASKAGILSQRGLQLAEKVINPAQMLFDAAGLATRGVRKGMTGLLRATRGADEAEIIMTNLANSWVSKYAGMPDEAAKAIRGFESRVATWRERGAEVIRSAKKLGGRRAQDLLGEAMELDALYYLRKGSELTDTQRRAYDSFRRKLQAEGISEHLFMQVYDNFRALDDTIGSELAKLGLLSSREVAQYQGIHLRRVYQAFERPEQYIDRLEALVEKFPNATRANKKLLRDAISEAIPDIQRTAYSGWDGTGMQGLKGLRKYIDPKTRKFQANRLVDDIDNLVRTNSNESINTLLNRVKTDILELPPGPIYNGINGNEDAAKIFARIADSVSGALFEQKGAQHYVDILRARMNGVPYKWRTMKENLQLIEARTNVPQEIREALGEVMSAAPRMAREVGETSGLMEFRRLADTLTGTSRITAENFPEIMKLREAVKAGTMKLEDALEVARRTIDPELTAKMLMEGTEGQAIFARGTSGAARTREAIEGAAVKLPDDEMLGSLSGQWVKPAIARMVNNIVDTTPGLKKPAEQMAATLGNFYRSRLFDFKALKVVWDPTAQARNFIGNMILADFQGTVAFRPDLVRKTAHSLRSLSQGNPDHYARLAAESGYDLFGSTFSKAELNRMGDLIGQADLVGRESSATGILSKMFEGLGNIFPAYHERMSRLFQFNEELFKMSVFIDQFEKLKTPLVRRGVRVTAAMEKNMATQAAALAEQALFNYADLPYAVEFIRNTGAIPFITFPFKASQFTAKTLYEHPLRVLKHHRIAREWTDWLSGSPDDTAREVEGLPRYLRESLVTRLPFKDRDGRPLYVDFSYFMPYAVVKELAESTKQMLGFIGIGEGTTSPRDFGLREGYFTPPLIGLIDMFRRGEDPLGRQIFKPEYTVTQNLQSLGNTLLEFILPPSFPGGSRAETMGRALQALVRSDPEPQNWMEHLAVPLRGFGPTMNEAFTYPGLRPQTGAAVGGSQATQFFNLIGEKLGMEPSSSLAAGGGLSTLFGAAVETAILGGATASDPVIDARQAMTHFNNQLSNVARQIAQVRSNPNLSREEKVKRIQRLVELREQVLRDRGRK